MVQPDEAPLEQLPIYKNRKFMLPLLIGVAALALIALLLYFNSRDYISTDDAFIDGDRQTISSKYAGKVSKITVKEGDKVQQGQLLVELDQTDLKAQSDQAQAALVYAQKNYNLSVVNLAKAQDDFARADSQFKTGVITKEQFDHAQKALEAAKAQSGIAQAQIGTANAQLGIVSTQLSNSSIISPVSGVVARKWATEGDVVQMAQPILAVYDLKSLWVTANLEETKYSRLRQDQDVVIHVDAFGKDYKGKITALGSSTAAQFSLIPPNNAAGNFTKITQRIPIKISISGIENNDVSNKEVLLPGMSVEVRLKLKP
jgi:membrane fusion protein, multidrug efflux system